MSDQATDFVVITGFSSRRRGYEIAQAVGADFPDIDYVMHNNGEIVPTVQDSPENPTASNMRGADVVVIAGASGDPNTIIFETQLLIDIARKNHAKSITVVLPSLHYGRQDSNFGVRAPHGLLRALENFLQTGDKAIICDPHNLRGTSLAIHAGLAQTQFIHYAPVFSWQLKALGDAGHIDLSKCVIMGLDKGGAERMGRDFLQAISAITEIATPNDGRDLPYLDKRRDRKTGAIAFHGAVNMTTQAIRGKTIIIFEDMIDTGGSVIDAATYLKEKGAARVIVLASNGLFSAKRERAAHEVTCRDGTVLIPPYSRQNPDPAASIKKLDAAGANLNGPDLILVSNMYDFALTDPEIAVAIAKSPLIHELDVTGYLAEMILAIHDPNRATNSVTARLRGDAQHISPERAGFTTTSLKAGNRLLTAAV